MNGANIIVTAEDGTLYATRTDEIQTNCETIEIASPASGAWRSYIAGRKDWSISTAFLVGANHIKTDLLKVGQTMRLTIKDKENPASSLSGSAILTTCKISANKGNLVQGSFMFLGTGELC